MRQSACRGKGSPLHRVQPRAYRAGVARRRSPRAPPLWIDWRGQLKPIFLAGAAAAALAACTDHDRGKPRRRPKPPRSAPRVPVPDNILLADWTGPYRRRAAVRPGASPSCSPRPSSSRSTSSRREVAGDRRQSRPRRPSPTRSRRSRKSGERLDRVDIHLRGDDRQHDQPRISGARARMVAASLAAAFDEIILNPKLVRSG